MSFEVMIQQPTVQSFYSAFLSQMALSSDAIHCGYAMAMHSRKEMQTLVVSGG